MVNEHLAWWPGWILVYVIGKNRLWISKDKQNISISVGIKDKLLKTIGYSVSIYHTTLMLIGGIILWWCENERIIFTPTNSTCQQS